MRLLWAPALLLLTGCGQPAHVLDLTATVEGQHIFLRWPQPIATPEAAILSITDAGRHEAVQLTLDAVRKGTIAYQPVGGDVSFHLVIHDFTHGRSATGAARVIIRGVPAARPGALPLEPRLNLPLVQQLTSTPPLFRPHHALSSRSMRVLRSFFKRREENRVKVPVLWNEPTPSASGDWLLCPERFLRVDRAACPRAVVRGDVSPA